VGGVEAGELGEVLALVLESIRSCGEFVLFSLKYL